MTQFLSIGSTSQLSRNPSLASSAFLCLLLLLLFKHNITLKKLEPMKTVSKYMHQSPRKKEPALHQSDNYIDSIFQESHCTPSSIEDTRSTYFEDTIDITRDSEALHEYHDESSQRYGNANNYSQSRVPNIDLGVQEQILREPLPIEMTSQFVARNDHALLRGVESYAEMSRLDSQKSEHRRRGAHVTHEVSSQVYGTHRRSFSLESPALAHMQSLPYPSSRHSSAPPHVVARTRFEPFGGLFNSSADAKRHRHLKMRFDRRAYNSNDVSIPGIEADRTKQVERIYNAMIRGDLARDNYKSVAMKRWTREPHYPSDLVEAYAHKVFDCLLQQAKEGFRGWHHNDYVVDDRKGDDVDRDTDCAGRLDNIILALEQEKTICEDVMNSACQIRMFVNAPRAYANRKHQNRIGNSKRPNAGAKDDPDAHLRPSKLHKTGGRRTKAHPSASSGILPSSNATPQQPPDATGMPYFVTPTSRQVAMSPLSRSHLVPQASSFSGPATSALQLSASFEPRHADAMPPPALSPRAPARNPQLLSISRIISMPLTQPSPFAPPTSSLDYYSAPLTPHEVRPIDSNPVTVPWKPITTSSGPSCSNIQQNEDADTSFFSQVMDWSQNVLPFTQCEDGASTSLFAHFPGAGVTLADVQHLPPNHVEGNTISGADLETMWSQHRGLHGFPYDDLSPGARPQP